MKATGIVRRIDELGRIVVPKEIRRTLRIREGDPLEIFTGREGEIVLKKYSPIGEMSSFAKQYAESLAQVSGRITLIADRDQFIATAGGGKIFDGKGLSRHLEDVLDRRETILAGKGEKQFLEIASDVQDAYEQEMIGIRYPDGTKHLWDCYRAICLIVVFQKCNKHSWWCYYSII